MNKKVLIGVAWPYVNGDLHIGHLAGYLLPADIAARYHRAIGNDVLMVSGSDCFGTPITVEADKRNLTPKDIVAEYHAKDEELFNNILNLSYDCYTKTDHPNHIKTTQDFFVKLFEEGFIFIDSTDQYYSPTENRFLPDRYVVGQCPFCNFNDSRSDQCDNCGKLITQGELINARSNLSGSPVELKQTSHYFLDWPKMQEKLKKYVDENSSTWKEWVKTETYGWLKEGLQPRAITRDLDWGVPIPVDRLPADKVVEGVEHKRIYVWFDAVIGYYSASLLWAVKNSSEWQPFWYNNDAKHYYFMGKDNLVFHTLFWPGQLMGFDENLHLPDTVSINMFLDLDGKKFSKSRGVTIGSKEIVEQYGNDAVRFYLTLIMPETRDSSFSWQDFSEKVNGILVANLGNFIHRSLSLSKNIDIKLLDKYPIWDETKAEVEKAFENASKYLEQCEFRNYLETITLLSTYGNKLVDTEKAWELKRLNPERFEEVSKQLFYIILALGNLINPLLPHASKRLADSLNVGFHSWIDVSSTIENLLPQIVITPELKPLFNKIEIESA